MSSLKLSVDPAVTDARIVHLRVGLPDADRPGRAVIWRESEASPAKFVVRMNVTRAGTAKAATGYELFEALGGETGAAPPDLSCEYREASALDLLRYETSARWDALLAVLGAIAAAATAFLTLDKAADTETGIRWTITSLVFIVGLLVTVIKLRKELSDIGP